MKTWTGVFVSIAISAITLLFGLVKLEHLIERKSPTISTSMSLLEEGTVYETDSSDFMLAVSLENFDTNEALSDPRYIRWYATIYEVIEGEYTTRWY